MDSSTTGNKIWKKWKYVLEKKNEKTGSCRIRKSTNNLNNDTLKYEILIIFNFKTLKIICQIYGV